MDTALLPFCLSLALVAALYGSVGQAGASGFVALMALYGLAPDTIKPTALALNVLVSAAVAWRFARDGHFSWRLLWPFLAGSMPAAAIGGYLVLPAGAFQALLGSLLLVAGVPMLLRPRTVAAEPLHRPRALAVLAGAAIGLASGLTGMGGGVLLTPLLIHGRWAHARAAAACSAMFILLNSLMALLGHLGAMRVLPAELPWFALAAVAGGLAGARLGSRHMSAVAVQRVLGVTLVVAGVKLVWVG